MKKSIWLLSVTLFSGLIPTVCHAEKGTVPVPTCLTFLGNTSFQNTYAPCNGVIPVDIHGNPTSWSDVFNGTSSVPSSPTYQSIVTDGIVVSNNHSLPVSDLTLSSVKGILGSAIPNTALLIGAKDGAGNLKSILVDTAGIVQVNCPSCSGGGSGSNAAALSIGTSNPLYGSYTAYLGADNTLYGWRGDNLGHPAVTLYGSPSVTVGNFPATQAVSASALPLPSGAATQSGLDNLGTKLDTISNNQSQALPSGTNMIGSVGGARVHWNETSTPLGTSATFNGATRDDGGTLSGGFTKWNSFGCFVRTDKIGTLNLQASNDGTTWFTANTVELDGTANYMLTQPLFTRYWRCQLVNGNVAQTNLILNSTFGD